MAVVAADLRFRPDVFKGDGGAGERHDNEGTPVGQIQPAAPDSLRILPRAGNSRGGGADAAAECLQKFFRENPCPVRKLQFPIQVGPEARHGERQKNAPCVVVVVDDRLPADVRPVPAAVRISRIAAVEEAAAAVEKGEQLFRDGRVSAVVENFVGKEEEQRGLKVAVGPPLFDHPAVGKVGPGGEAEAHLFERPAFGDSQPLRDPPGAVAGIHDAGSQKPVQVVSHRRFERRLHLHISVISFFRQFRMNSSIHC